MAGYRRAHIDYLNFHGLFLDGEYLLDRARTCDVFTC